MSVPVGDWTLPEQYRFLQEQEHKHTREVECRCGAAFIYTAPPMKMNFDPQGIACVAMRCFCGSMFPMAADATIIAAVPNDRRYSRKKSGS